MADCPLSETEKAAWCVYREALRNITEQDDFPWADVDMSTIPWPEKP